MTDRFVTIKQLITDHCPVSESMVRHWIRHEGLPIHRGSKAPDSDKGLIIIQLSEFFDWMEKRRIVREHVRNSVSQEAKQFVQELLA